MKAIRVFRSGLHLGEEKIIAGNKNSGMINFSGCHLNCNFCYTPETSVRKEGTDYSPVQFLRLLDDLVIRGAHNINLISPTHLWPKIKRPLRAIRGKYTSRLPIVSKISGYESNRQISTMAELTDVFVPDYKIYSESAALKLNLPPNYGEVAKTALSKMIQTHGEALYREDHSLRRGILVRHLMMPGFFEESLAVVSALKEVGYTGYFNVMTYYVDPQSRTVLNANPTELEVLTNRAHEFGLKVMVNGKVQSQPVHLEGACHG